MWRHIGLLLVALANLALAVFWYFRAQTGFSRMPLIAGISLRMASVLYLTLSVFVIWLAFCAFDMLELSDRARLCWRNHQQWQTLRIGMTRAEVVRRLGEPTSVGNADQYPIHPLDFRNAALFYEDSGNPEQRRPESRLVERLPDGPVEWLPPGAVDAARNDLHLAAKALAFIGILIFGVISLIPFRLQAGWNSSMLYLPVAIALCAVLYEMGEKGGWRFDLFLLMPAYLTVAITWLVRVIIVVRARAPGPTT